MPTGDDDVLSELIWIRATRQHFIHAHYYSPIRLSHTSPEGILPTGNIVQITTYFIDSTMSFISRMNIVNCLLLQREPAVCYSEGIGLCLCSVCARGRRRCVVGAHLDLGDAATLHPYALLGTEKCVLGMVTPSGDFCLPGGRGTKPISANLMNH